MKKLVLFLITFFILSCTNDSYSDLIENETTINLKWNKAYTDDTIDKSLIGLKWALSYIGATLPSSNTGFRNTDNSITINIKHLGFSEQAQEKLLILSEKIKATSEYQLNNSIDLGRYVSLLLGASEHYYEFIGTPKTLNEVLNNYTLLPQKGYVNNSSVSLEHRIIQFSEQNGFNQLFISEEISPITGEIYEYETIELLPNGQLRFGIFDIAGNRKPNADATHSNAGKPAKCMWCHESSINQMFNPQNDFPGFLNFNEFQNTLINYRENNRTQKLALTNGVNFSETQQHTLTELLYISFMEPSAERLSLEWNMPLNQVQNLLSGLSTHVYDEFPFLGNLYNRNEVEFFAPFQGLTVSTNVREESINEVNHLND
ncbi:hypothetical protein [Flavobacterium capsici]|uniref:Uncharacterized protein n=1 Tax=Flavobacterium capsici TaxID=3075618 RepID=A0AA96J3Z3_9FLAO|nr:MULTISPECIES: hypothetical protein [unclassified Flavobacterium]WNM19371.1 hypothetical protein RN608_01510 [Flavobacterium sp. PMR2A8]WNM20760.1 hypothetical protein RN605_08680 [Flavobacterium sp. PMTSA4]